jgi:hypothetical protein
MLVNKKQKSQRKEHTKNPPNLKNRICSQRAFCITEKRELADQPEGVRSVFSLSHKSNQTTWLTATLDFSLVFHCVFCFLPHLCTVVSKKTKLSCFGGLFSLVSKNQATAWFSCSCLHLK